jgi:hypothetical protein
VESWKRYERCSHSPVPAPWTNEEERRTVAGYIAPGVLDPICDNCFHLYDSVVHGRPYTPRIGHCDYRSSDADSDADQDKINRTELSAYLLTPEAKEIIENFPKYMIR